VLIGTRLLLSEESPIHPDLKRSMVAACETDTVTVWDGPQQPAGVEDRAAERAAELEAAGAPFEEIIKVVAGSLTRSMFETGDPDEGIIVCSQDIG